MLASSLEVSERKEREREPTLWDLGRRSSRNDRENSFLFLDSKDWDTQYGVCGRWRAVRGTQGVMEQMVTKLKMSSVIRRVASLWDL